MQNCKCYCWLSGSQQAAAWLAVQDKPIKLSRPGRYTAYFTARTVHQQAGDADVKESEVYTYKAECSEVKKCIVLSLPQRMQLRQRHAGMRLEFRDDFDNIYGSKEQVRVDFQCEKLLIEPAADQTASWVTSAQGSPQLQLPSFEIQPTAALGFDPTKPTKPIRCHVKVVVRGLQTRAAQVEGNFDLQVLPGKWLTKTLRAHALHLCPTACQANFLLLSQSLHMKDQVSCCLLNMHISTCCLHVQSCSQGLGVHMQDQQRYWASKVSPAASASLMNSRLVLWKMAPSWPVLTVQGLYYSCTIWMATL